MILSIATGVITIVNAAAFMMLTPGKLLGDYIACSAIYSAASWIILWILPAAWSDRHLGVARLRTLQLVVLLVTALGLGTTHPNMIGIAFSALLTLEAVFLFSSLLLLRSETALFQRLEFTRAVLNSAALCAAVVIFHKNPAAYCVLLALSMAMVGFGSMAAGLYKPPPISLSAASPRTLLADALVAFKSGRTYALVAARSIEIGSLLVFSLAGSLGAQICLKLGIASSQMLAPNAHRYKATALALAAISIYAVAIVACVLLLKFRWPGLPPTLTYVKPELALLAAPSFLLHLGLSLFALRRPA